MKEITNLTTYQRNARAAKEQFQAQMNKYGLKVDHCNSGGTYCDNCMEFFNLRMVTEKLPVKGNKKLIERLEADHFWVQKWLNTVPGAPRQYVFRVCKTATIATGRADRIGRDLIELERKLYDGTAVCASDMTERQKHNRVLCFRSGVCYGIHGNGGLDNGGYAGRYCGCNERRGSQW